MTKIICMDNALIYSYMRDVSTYELHQNFCKFTSSEYSAMQKKKKKRRENFLKDVKSRVVTVNYLYLVVILLQ